jgi:hypothetical protein
MYTLQVLDFNSGELSNKLYLFQYPLRAVERPYGDQGELSSVQYNTSQTDTTIKMNYNIDSKSKNFDISGEQKVTQIYLELYAIFIWPENRHWV